MKNSYLTRALFCISFLTFANVCASDDFANACASEDSESIDHSESGEECLLIASLGEGKTYEEIDCPKLKAKLAKLKKSCKGAFDHFDSKELSGLLVLVCGLTRYHTAVKLEMPDKREAALENRLPAKSFIPFMLDICLPTVIQRNSGSITGLAEKLAAYAAEHYDPSSAILHKEYAPSTETCKA